MNTTQHTPGQWDREIDTVFIGSKSHNFAEHHGDSLGIANARLISAAPDMFDALQAVCDAYGDRDTLLMAQCKTALAKAKGGAA
jgi:hypothetical protein